MIRSPIHLAFLAATDCSRASDIFVLSCGSRIERTAARASSSSALLTNPCISLIRSTFPIVSISPGKNIHESLATSTLFTPHATAVLAGESEPHAAVWNQLPKQFPQASNHFTPSLSCFCGLGNTLAYPIIVDGSGRRQHELGAVPLKTMVAANLRQVRHLRLFQITIGHVRQLDQQRRVAYIVFGRIDAAPPVFHAVYDFCFLGLIADFGLC